MRCRMLQGYNNRWVGYITRVRLLRTCLMEEGRLTRRMLAVHAPEPHVVRSHAKASTRPAPH